jgi:hypothetical protein
MDRFDELDNLSPKQGTSQHSWPQVTFDAENSAVKQGIRSQVHGDDSMRKEQFGSRIPIESPSNKLDMNFSTNISEDMAGNGVYPSVGFSDFFEPNDDSIFSENLKFAGTDGYHTTSTAATLKHIDHLTAVWQESRTACHAFAAHNSNLEEQLYSARWGSARSELSALPMRSVRIATDILSCSVHRPSSGNAEGSTCLGRLPARAIREFLSSSGAVGARLVSVLSHGLGLLCELSDAAAAAAASPDSRRFLLPGSSGGGGGGGATQTQYLCPHRRSKGPSIDFRAAGFLVSHTAPTAQGQEAWYYLHVPSRTSQPALHVPDSPESLDLDTGMERAGYAPAWNSFTARSLPVWTETSPLTGLEPLLLERVRLAARAAGNLPRFVAMPSAACDAGGTNTDGLLRSGPGRRLLLAPPVRCYSEDASSPLWVAAAAFSTRAGGVEATGVLSGKAAMGPECVLMSPLLSVAPEDISENGEVWLSGAESLRVEGWECVIASFIASLFQLCFSFSPW